MKRSSFILATLAITALASMFVPSVEADNRSVCSLDITGWGIGTPEIPYPGQEANTVVVHFGADCLNGQVPAPCRFVLILSIGNGNPAYDQTGGGEYSFICNDGGEIDITLDLPDGGTGEWTYSLDWYPGTIANPVGPPANLLSGSFYYVY